MYHVYICILFQIFAIIGYYKILNMVPCAIDPCHLSILYIVVYIGLSQTTYLFFSPTSQLTDSFCEGPESKQLTLCRLPYLHCSYSSLLLWHESSRRWCVNKYVWLSSNKTLFMKQAEVWIFFWKVMEMSNKMREQIYYI